MKRSAVISGCGAFRYVLTRNWTDDDTSVLLFVMLNPSTADADIDDPTIRKCIGFSQRLGYGGIEVVNLYAYRATDPKALKAAGYQVGPDNNRYTMAAIRRAHNIVLAWGANARGMIRPDIVLRMVREAGVTPMALRRLADGVPEHPLMLPYSCTLQPL
jgi:hypothetical protein